MFVYFHFPQNGHYRLNVFRNEQDAILFAFNELSILAGLKFKEKQKARKKPLFKSIRLNDPIPVPAPPAPNLEQGIYQFVQDNGNAQLLREEIQRQIARVEGIEGHQFEIVEEDGGLNNAPVPVDDNDDAIEPPEPAYSNPYNELKLSKLEFETKSNLISTPELTALQNHLQSSTNKLDIPFIIKGMELYQEYERSVSTNDRPSYIFTLQNIGVAK